MSHPLEHAVDALLAPLRGTGGEGALGAQATIAPGVTFYADDSGGTVAGRFVTGGTGLLRLVPDFAGPCRWMSLALASGRLAFAEGDTLGVVADLQADAPCDIGLLLRSGGEGAFRDTEFPDRLRTGPEGGVQVALLTVAAQMPLAGPPAPRALLLKLPPRPGALEIRDLRVFVLPAAAEPPADGAGVPDPGEGAPA